MHVCHEQYHVVLEPWPKASEKYLYVCPDRPDLECYGTGCNGWGVQTNQKAFAALAVLAAHPDLDETRAGMSRDEMLDHALRMLRFCLESHIEGPYHCTDGTSWGHTWISALGTERMMHGVEAVEQYLTDADHNLLRRILISESNWLLDEYDIVAGTVKNNRPESNLWNGALLHRTALMYPDLPRAAAYREKGSRFLVNAISIASDASATAPVDGRPVSEWYVGDNFFESFACNHHGYLNVGYMVICLSNAAMLHFAFRKRGLKPPEALYHHVRDLWQLVKQLTFPDGRLTRIGGDTRVRYCYCQDYAIPAWLMMIDRFGDLDCVRFEAGWLAQVEKEMAANGDGAFLSKRCRQLEKVSPLYYTRLEADRAVTLSMGAHWRRVLDIPRSAPDKPEPAAAHFAWHDEYHGASFHRSAKRAVSWVWRAAETPQGLCLPADGSDLAEWRLNLVGEIHGQGRINFQDVIEHHEETFEGGFITWGRTTVRSRQMVAEGRPDDNELCTQDVVFAALPDKTTAILLQRAVTSNRRSYVNSVKGLHLLIPNDIFNGNRRVYYSGCGARELQGVGSREELLTLKSSWVNIDDRIAVIRIYGASPLCIYRPGGRQIGLRQRQSLANTQAGGMLYADEICSPCRLGLRPCDPNTLLYDIGFVIQVGVTHEEAANYARTATCVRLNSSSPPDVRAMLVDGTDGKTYLLVANLGKETARVELKLPNAKRLTDLLTAQTVSLQNNILSQRIAGETAVLFESEHTRM